MKTKYSIKSFRGKLTVALIVCILIPALLTLFIYNYLTRDAVKDQAVLNAQQTLQLVDGHVTGTLKNMLYILNFIQYDTGMNMTFQDFSLKSGDMSNPSYEEFRARQEVLIKLETITGAAETSAGEKSFVTVFLNNGTYFTNYWISDYDPTRLLKESWLNKVRSLKGIESYWVGESPTQFLQDKADSPYQLTVARSLSSQNGFIVVTILERQIGNYFKELAKSQGQEIILLDKDDRILSHADVSKIGEAFPYLKEQNSKSPEIVQIDHQNYLISKREFPMNGWKLVSLIPYSQAVGTINGIFENVFTLQVVSFILFFILLMVAIRAFTRPLVKLDKVATSIQQGNLHVRSAIRGEDEIGRLGKSFDQMLDHISDMIIEVTHTQARKRKAELDMLQAQINPHFLFNVLNSIRMKVLGRGDRESADMISSLSKLMRMTIQDKAYILLHDEVDIVMDYMKLMNMRQKEKVTLETYIDADVFLERVPRFFLQPIIENALIHGFNQQAGTITLEAQLDEGYIRISVRDNGQGMDPITLARLRSKLFALPVETALIEPDKKKGFSSIGLPNVNERMRMTFGEAYRMEVDSEEGVGTSVTLLIPKQEEVQEDV
ncbi:sensor histidine kinase [Paenibacillus alba]|uniref:histidine kinase n=1 Tax=Paenibacillus alba TaxID=1197127 RepID=UPI001564103F|nr:sensor histidine kinase [Paenibacillus alba]